MNSLLHTKQFLLPTTILLCVLLNTALAPVGAQGADSTAETNPLHAAGSDRVSARPELVITTPGFGSCARQNRPQPIWDTIYAARCEAFVLGGDNICGDSSDPAVLREKYTQARGVLVISGDRHLAELSALTPADGVPYPLYDLTTSGLNQLIPQIPQPKEGNSKAPEPKPAVPSKPQPNRHRLHERPCTGANFGLMRLKWDGPNPSIRLEVCGLEGDVDLSREIPFSELRSK